MINKKLIASFMIDKTAEDFVNEYIDFPDLDTFEVDMLCATGGILTTVKGKKIFITPNSDKSDVICLELTPFNSLVHTDYHPTWEELSTILEKEHYEPSWVYPNLSVLPSVERLISNYMQTHRFKDMS